MSLLSFAPKPRGFLKALVICKIDGEKRMTMKLPTRADALECGACRKKVKVLQTDRDHQVLIGSW